MNIYEKMVAAGVEIAHHESDLYVPVNEITTAIVDDYQFACIVTKFLDNITHTPWYDIPFAYDPYDPLKG